MTVDLRFAMLGLILGLAGIFVPMLWPTKKVLGYICLAAAVAFAVLWAELEVHGHAARVDESTQNQKAQEEVGKRSNSILPSGQQRTTTVLTMTILPAETPLREVALLLSTDILNFLVERDQNAPPYANIATWAIDEKKVRDYDAETLILFTTDFGVNVKQIRDELARNGQRDPGLDDLYEKPTNIQGMRLIAEKIGAMAEKLSH